MLTNEGRRHYGLTMRTPEMAYDYAVKFAKTCAPDRILTLQDGFSLLLNELKSKSAREATIKFYGNHWRVVTNQNGWGADLPLHQVTADQI